MFGTGALRYQYIAGLVTFTIILWKVPIVTWPEKGGGEQGRKSQTNGPQGSRCGFGLPIGLSELYVSQYRMAGNFRGFFE